MRKAGDGALRFGPAENREVPRGPVLERLRSRVVLMLQVQQNDVARVTGRKTGDLQVIMHQLAGLRERMVFRREELFLVVVVRTPREHTPDVQVFTKDLPHHIPRLDAFGWVHVMGTAGGVYMVIAGEPAEVRGIDPALELEGDFAGIGGKFAGAGQVLGPTGVLGGVGAVGKLHGFAGGAIDLRLEEKVWRQSPGRRRVGAVAPVVADVGSTCG